MKTTKLQPLSRLLGLIAGLALIASLFLPIWRIDLIAPQYPEGIFMQIYANKLGGDVEIINGLNHYIGMATIHEEDFVEFKVLPYIIGFFVFMGIMVWLINRRWFLYLTFGLFMVFAVAAMYDFWKWEYDYGHNLDPTAPIQIPGMAYQPPLIGSKVLANFIAWSFPDTGGFFFIGAGVLLLAAVILEWRAIKKSKKAIAAASFALMISMSLVSCNPGPRPIEFGQVDCASCKMKLMDNKYGVEFLTDKGKVFIFDDLVCAENFAMSNDTKGGSFYVVDFANPGKLIKSEAAFYAEGGSFSSPMGSNTAAFSNEDVAKKMAGESGATLKTWTPRK